MKNNSTSSAPKTIVKLARSRGRRDGKNQVPRQEWGTESVPYLVQLQRQYAAYGKELDLEFDELKSHQEARKVNSMRKEIQEQAKSSALSTNLSRAEAQLTHLQHELKGDEEEVPMAKFARVRLITNLFYRAFLFLLFIGEFTITAPAFRFLLGERKVSSTIVAIAVSGLSVGAAHIFGIFLKSKFDRSRPKSGTFSAIFYVVACFVIFTIFFLSFIRANSSLQTAGNLSISDGMKLNFLWAFFTILQLTFVVVGTAVSFMHYSEIESAVLRGKWRVWFLRRLQDRRTNEKSKSGSSVEESNIDVSNLMAREAEVLESKKILLRAQYEEVSAIYRDSNIHSRRDEMDGAHHALQPLALVFNDLEFTS